VPQIDRLLTMLAQSRAGAVELLDGEPAAFVTGADRRPVTRAPLAAAQILAFVREVAPPDVAATLGTLQPVEFGYANGDGRWAVRVARFGDRWGATVTPAGGAPTAPPGAAPEARPPRRPPSPGRRSRRRPRRPAARSPPPSACCARSSSAAGRTCTCASASRPSSVPAASSSASTSRP
jgi:hypothetical protein